MARIHYLIDARKKVRIQKAKGRINIFIENVVSLEENGVTKIDQSMFINDSENEEKKLPIIDKITCILYALAIILVLIALGNLGVGKDVKIFNSSHIDNVIGFAALIFGLASVPKVKEFLSRIVNGPIILNKLWYILMMLCIPFYIVWVMDFMGFSLGISNICGIIGIIIGIITW